MNPRYLVEMTFIAAAGKTIVQRPGEPAPRRFVQAPRRRGGHVERLLAAGLRDAHRQRAAGQQFRITRDNVHRHIPRRRLAAHVGRRLVIADQQIDRFARFGLVIERFGPGAMLVRALPAEAA